MILNEGIASRRNTGGLTLQEILSSHLESLTERFYNKTTHTFDYQHCSTAQNFYHAVLFSRKLQTFDLNALINDHQRLAFWLNTYNLLLIHVICTHGEIDSIKDISRFFRSHKYQIGAFTFSLDDIEHGILRRNQRSPGSLTRQFDDSDPRLAFLVNQIDPRIHAALYSASVSSAPLQYFSEENIEQELTSAISGFLGKTVRLSLDRQKLILPKVLHWYRKDLAQADHPSQAAHANKNTALVEFVTHWLEDRSMAERIQSNPGMKEAFLPFQWKLNAP